MRRFLTLNPRVLPVGLIIALGVGIFPAWAAAPTFVWRNPTPQGGGLNGLTFAANRFVAVGAGGRILTSTDGATWHVAAVIPDMDINDVAFDGSLWVIVGTNGRILTSPDTATWTNRSSPTAQTLFSVTYATNQFLACGFNGFVATSPDGITWTARPTGATQSLRDVAGRPGAYVTVGDGNTLLTSPDTISWSRVSLAEPLANLNTVAFLVNQFVVIGGAGRIYSSPDGVTWTSRGSTTATGNSYSGVTHDGTQYVIGNLNGPLTYTTNLTARTAVTPTFNPGINRSALASGAGVTVVAGTGGEIATTTDARVWTLRGSDGVINQFQGAAYLNSRWFAVGTGWTVSSSSDGAQWTRHAVQNRPPQGASGFNGVSYGANRYVAVGDLGFIATSTDGVSWEGVATASGTTQALNYITFANGRFTAVGDGGVIINSADGLTWAAAASGVTTGLLAVGALGGTSIAVGANGVILTSANSTTWTRATTGTTQSLHGVGVFNNTAYVVGVGRTILASTNAQTWTTRAVPPLPPGSGTGLNAITTANGGLLTVGSSGVALFSADGVTWSHLPALAYRSSLLGAASDGSRAVVVGLGGAILQSVDPAAPPSRLVNVATRGFVQPGGALTPGFVLRGTGSKQVVVRAIGPTLTLFGLPALADLKLDLVNQQTNATVATNDDWGGTAALSSRFASLGAFPLEPASRDAAVQAALPVNNGGYSVRITASGTGVSGVALAEVYDADDASSTVRLANVSTLGFVGTNENVLTPGFVISGTAPKRLLIRAIGPGLVPLGVDGVLADPQFSVFPAGASVAIAGSNDWGGTPALRATFMAAGAFALADNSRDAAVDVTLPPGGYTVVTSGVGNTTGTALVEVYDLDP